MTYDIVISVTSDKPREEVERELNDTLHLVSRLGELGVTYNGMPTDDAVRLEVKHGH